MDVIRPLEVEASHLDSSTVALEYPVWDNATNWVEGDNVIHDLQVWTAAVDNADSEPSETNTDWARQGYAMRWRMYREGSDSATSKEGGFTNEVTPGELINSVAALNCEGLEIDFTMTDPTDGVVYQQTYPLFNNGATDWYDFYFGEKTANRNVIATDLPAYPDATIKMEIKTASPTDTASIGRYAHGRFRTLGEAQYGVSIRRRTFSVRERDPFGNLRIVSRRQVPLVDYRVAVPSGDVDLVVRELEDLQDRPAVYMGSRDKYTSAIVFGYYRDYQMTISTPSISDLTIEVVGY